MVEPDNPQMTMRLMRFASWISKATNTHTHTHTIFNTCCLSTSKMKTRTRLSVTFTRILEMSVFFNPLNAELNPICHLLTLLGGATIVVVSRLRANYYYGYYTAGQTLQILTFYTFNR